MASNKKDYSLTARLVVKDAMSKHLATAKANFTGLQKTISAFNASGAVKQFKILSRNVKNASSDLAHAGLTLAKPFTLLAGSVGFSMGAVISNFSATGDAIDKMSQRVQVNAELLQGWQIAAGHAGVSNADLEIGLRKLNQTMGAVATGGRKDAASMFEALGISVRKANGEMKTAEELFPDIAEAIKVNEDPVMRQKIAFTLLGEAGAKMIPMLTGGRQALKDQADEAKRLGQILDEETIASAATMTDAMGDLNMTLKALSLVIGKHIAPLVIRLSQRFQELIAANREAFSEKFAEVAKQFANAIERVNWEAIVNVLMATATWAFKVFNWFGGLNTVFSAFGVVMGVKVVKSLFNVGQAFVGLGRAIYLATGPVGILAIAIGSLIAWAWNSVEGFKEKFLSAIQGVLDVVYGLFSYVSAFLSGDVEKMGEAGEQMLNGLKAAFFGFVQSCVLLLKGMWNAVKDYLPDAIRKPIENAITSVQESFEGVKDWVLGLFEEIRALADGIVNGIRSAFTSLVTAISKPMDSAIESIKTRFETVKNWILGFFEGFDWKKYIPDFALSLMGYDGDAKSATVEKATNVPPAVGNVSGRIGVDVRTFGNATSQISSLSASDNLILEGNVGQTRYGGD